MSPSDRIFANYYRACALPGDDVSLPKFQKPNRVIDAALLRTCIVGVERLLAHVVKPLLARSKLSDYIPRARLKVAQLSHSARIRGPYG